ncbi:MAG: glycosyltransferase, partial [Lachnospiraceae bacterium]|nr:glycosyltransferase [Lachnospiraceae bacterium]
MNDKRFDSIEMIKVSVIVATYNQEKYIAKTLESVVSQKTDFKYEVLVGDDASKDGTGRIVKEFGKKYPDIIRPIVREKNIGAYRNFLDLLKRAKGEYLALLEGDDYWVDEEKLKKQVSFL